MKKCHKSVDILLEIQLLISKCFFYFYLNINYFHYLKPKNYLPITFHVFLQMNSQIMQIHDIT